MEELEVVGVMRVDLVAEEEQLPGEAEEAEDIVEEGQVIMEPMVDHMLLEQEADHIILELIRCKLPVFKLVTEV